MKVINIQNAFGFDNLEMVERDDPKAGPGQVLIKIRAAALNFRDLLVIKGLYDPNLALPIIPVSDGVGEVVAVGNGVTRVNIGERVAGIQFQNWLSGDLTEAKARSSLGGPLDGMLAEYVVLPEDGVVRVPDHLTDEEAATLPCTALTAWHAVIVEGKLKPGDTVLIQGTGGVSLFALQFAHLLGARTIVTSSSNAKLEIARNLGASDCINYRSTPDWEQRVLEMTDGIGVALIIEIGGTATIAKSIAAVQIGGRINLVGLVSGLVAEINLFSLLMRNAEIKPIAVGSRDMFEAMNQAIAQHKLRPYVNRVFPFYESKQAFEYFEHGDHLGKICIRL